MTEPALVGGATTVPLTAMRPRRSIVAMRALYIALWFAVVAPICGAVAAVALASRRRGGTGFLLGYLFGPLGVLVALGARAAAPPHAPSERREAESRQN